MTDVTHSPVGIFTPDGETMVKSPECAWAGPGLLSPSDCVIGCEAYTRIGGGARVFGLTFPSQALHRETVASFASGPVLGGLALWVWELALSGDCSLGGCLYFRRVPASWVILLGRYICIFRFHCGSAEF